MMEGEASPRQGPKYIYTSIEQITQSLAEEQFNVYGVVTECTAPRATRGKGE